MRQQSTDVQKLLKDCPGYMTSLRLAKERLGRLDKTKSSYEQNRDKLQGEIERYSSILDSVYAAVDTLDPIAREIITARYLSSDIGRCQLWRKVCIVLYGNFTDSKMRSIFRTHHVAVQKLHEKFGHKCEK